MVQPRSPVRLGTIIVCTLILHSAMIALVASNWSSQMMTPPEPLPITARLELTPPPPSPPITAVAPVSSPPAKKEPPKPQVAVAPKPAAPLPIPRETVTATTALTEPEQPRESQAAVANTAPPAPAAPPAPPATPVKTSVSISATYAASNRLPVYPKLLERDGVQGAVMIRVFVKADGTAGDVEIKSSSGYPSMDEAARTAVRTWRFNPATVDGKPIAEWYLVPIPFKLQN